MHRGKSHRRSRRRTLRRLGGRKKTHYRRRRSMRGGYGSATAISPFNASNPLVYKPETLPDPRPVPGVPMKA